MKIASAAYGCFLQQLWTMWKCYCHWTRKQSTTTITLILFKTEQGKIDNNQTKCSIVSTNPHWFYTEWIISFYKCVDENKIDAAWTAVEERTMKSGFLKMQQESPLQKKNVTQNYIWNLCYSCKTFHGSFLNNRSCIVTLILINTNSGENGFCIVQSSCRKQI